MTRAAAIALLGALLSAAACSSEDTTTSTTTTSSTSGTGGSGGGVTTPAGSCIQPGDKGNAQGVGEWCSPGGGQCNDFALAGACLADLGAAADNQWFCTRIGCKSDADCGGEATCVMQSGSSACVPNHCLEGAGGAGGAGGGAMTGAGGAGGG